MPSTLVEHQRIHLNNPNINYIRTDNCAYCKYEKRKGYRNRYPNRHRSFSFSVNSVQEYNPYNYTFYHIPVEEPDTKSTTLKKINDTTKLELNSEECFCAICQDKIKKWDIVRKLGCQHKFHQKCCDKWLETKEICPMCRQEL